MAAVKLATRRGPLAAWNARIVAFLTRGTWGGNSAGYQQKGLYRFVFAAGSAAPPVPKRRNIKNVGEPASNATYCRRGPLFRVGVQQGRFPMNNPNEKPGQQTQHPGQQNPGQKPGQQQQGGGQKPGQQQQDPG